MWAKGIKGHCVLKPDMKVFNEPIQIMPVTSIQ